MATFRLLALLVLMCGGYACAADGDIPKEKKALLVVPAEFRYLNSVMGTTEGDLNGDGVLDLALLVTGHKVEGQREERLFVFFGKADGSYQVLSMSDEFCNPSKSYNLDIKNNSLFVQAVYYADAARFSGFTLQFRYNARINDLEHIGELQEDEDYSNDSSYRVSLNFLTRAANSSRRSGKKFKEVKGRLTDAPGALPLNGFVCSGYGMTLSSVYIDDNFKVHKKGVTSP